MRTTLWLCLALGLVHAASACFGTGNDSPAADQPVTEEYDEEPVEEEPPADDEPVDYGSAESDADSLPDCDPAGADKMGTDSFSCPEVIEDVKGNTCCSSELEATMQEAVAAAPTDLKLVAEDMRAAVEAKFQGEWHCSVGEGDIGYAGYRVADGHCKISADTYYAICWLNYLKPPC